MRNKVPLGIAVSVLLASCATVTYTPPRGDGPIAQVTVTSAVRGGGLDISMLDRARCPHEFHWMNLAIFAPLNGYGDKGPYVVRAAARQYFKAYYDNSAGPYSRVACVSAGSFIPEQGRRYSVTQSLSVQGGRLACSFSVTDLDTGRAPATYERGSVQSCQEVSEPAA